MYLIKMKLPVDERKKYVLGLHKKGYKNREIAQELRISSRDIVKILKENEREEIEAREREEKEKAEKEEDRLFSSNRSEALKLYKIKTDPLDVAIALNISPQEATTIYYDYLSLANLSHLVYLHKKFNNKESFMDFTDLFIEKKGITAKEIIEGMNMIKERRFRILELEELDIDIAERKEVRDLLKEDNKSAGDYLAETQSMVNSTLEQKDKIDKAIKISRSKFEKKLDSINKINSSEDYYKVRETFKLEVEAFMNNKKNVIPLVILSIISALKNEPQKENIINGLLNSVDSNLLHNEDNMFYQNKLQKIAETTWDTISEVVTDNFLNS